MSIDFKKIRRVHCIGIGGIGISAIARMMLGQGKKVSGSDQTVSPIIRELAKLGVEIKIGHRAANVPPDADLVVYTIAIVDDNPELLEARRLTIPALSYPETLGLVSRDKYTIAVSGTHGKTTTTAMLARAMIAAGLDPTAIVGSLVNFDGGQTSSGGLTSVTVTTNFIAGRSQYFIVEACEYRRSFLHLSPRLLIITNIDNDHLDYYRDLTDIQSAFAELAGKIPPDGALVCDVNDPRLKPVLLDTRCPTIDYRSAPLAVKLRVPGSHNILNAQAAAAAAGVLGVSPSVTLGALRNFRGTWRRFEYKGKTASGALVYDDYAHHPAEIKATLQAAREIAKKRIIVVFQPHLYSRTKLLFAEFAECFADADEVIVTDIYAAREPADETVNGASLASAINRSGPPARHLRDFAAIKKYLLQTVAAGDLILTLGAGDIFELAEDLV